MERLRGVGCWALLAVMGACGPPGGGVGYPYLGGSDLDALGLDGLVSDVGDVSGTDADGVAPDDADGVAPDDTGDAQDAADGVTPADASDGTGGDAGPCVPQCEGKACGSDGCGKECGTCGAGTACDLSGQCVSAACGGQAPAVAGTLTMDVASVVLTEVVADVTHKLDVDPFEDGCIARVALAFGHSLGCELSLVATGRYVWQGGLHIASLKLVADSFCPGFSDEDEGVYVDTGGLVVAEVVPSVAEVPEDLAQEACWNGTLTVRLGGTLHRESDGHPLQIVPSELVVSGDITSTGDTEAACPCAPDCSAAVCGDDGCGGTCGACAAPVHGSASCTGGACVAACDPGYHGCGGACVSDGDPQTCGSACSPCPSPAFGEATCVGGSCGVACATGYHPCGGACASDADPTACGAACASCPVPQHGVAVCQAGACGVSCDPGFHGCGSACAADDDPTACGAGCVACPQDPQGQALCVGGACQLACNPGFHLCGGACVSNASPATCGSACSPCPEPSHGEATCTGGQCGIACDPGYHGCAGACLSDTSPASCGAACSPCPAPAQGTATCVGGACGFTCDAGTHACGATCASDTSPASCGTACSPCSAPANADATCDDGACGYACKPGYIPCEGACVLPGDATDCEVACGDGVDDDQDGLTDCEDFDCASTDASCVQACGASIVDVHCGYFLYSGQSVSSSGGKLNAYACTSENLAAGERVYAFTAGGSDQLVEVVRHAGATQPLSILTLADTCEAGSCVAATADVGVATHYQPVPAGHTYYFVIDAVAGISSEYFSVSCAKPEACADEEDNDFDGQTDCQDADCLSKGYPCEAAEATCGDGVDNDSDGQTDCFDAADCGAKAPCQAVESLCADGIDNDADGDVDCTDPSCSGLAPCEPVEVTCGDGLDNDGDGLTDCDDHACASTLAECVQACGSGGKAVDCGYFLYSGSGVGSSGGAMNAYACSAGNLAGKEVVYTFTATSDRDLDIYRVAEGHTFRILTLEDTCDNVSCIAATEGTDAVHHLQAVQAGHTYHFVIDAEGPIPTGYFSVTCL